MIWAIAAFFGNIIEQLLITSVVREIHPVVYVALFYLFSLSFLAIYNWIVKKDVPLFHWRDAWQHKFLVAGFAGGASLGNALWFTSVYLIGVGMTGFLLVFIRVIVTVYAYIYMKDRFPLDKAVAFASGVVMLFVFSFQGGAENIVGVVTAILSCVGFALEGITRKKLAENNLKPEEMLIFRNTCQFLLSWIVLGSLVFLGHVEASTITALNMTSFLLIVGAAFLGGIIVNMFVFHAMKEIKLSQYQALETPKPVFLAFFAMMLLGEEMSWMQMASGSAIIVSAFYFLLPARDKTPIKEHVP